MSYKPPYDRSDNGKDFKIEAKNDVENQCVHITDKFGFFLPVPFVIWNAVVNEHHWPRLQKQFKGVHPDQVYYMAMLEYCREYQFNYICLN